MKSFFGYLIVAVSIVLFGLFLKTGMDNKTYSNRTISARGVSERQVEATVGVGHLSASNYNDDLAVLKSTTENQIEQIKKGDLDQITKDKIIKELENKKYILENKED